MAARGPVQDCLGIRPDGLLVVGRRSDFGDYDALRLRWRSENTLIGGSRIGIMTYDDLLDWFVERLAFFGGADANGGNL
jgi:hypothetical protein